MIAVERPFVLCGIFSGRDPRSLGKVAALLMEETKDEPGERSNPRLYEDQAAAGNEDARSVVEKIHRCGEMMEHIEAKYIRDAGAAKREVLRVGNEVEPRAEDQVGRPDIVRETLEKTRAGARFDGNPSGLALAKHASKKLCVIDPAKEGFLFPDAAMAEELFLSMDVEAHSDE